jgi:virginiamycin B lyase
MSPRRRPTRVDLPRVPDDAGRPTARPVGRWSRRRWAAVLVAVLALVLPAAAYAAVATEITDPTPGATPSALAPASDGVTWFTDPGAGRIGRVGPTNVIQGFSANVASSPTAGPAPALTPNRIAVGPDGALWYTIQEGGIARMTTLGVVTRYTIRGAGRTLGITAGPDGAMWFTRPDQGQIGRITAPTDAQVTAGAVRGQVSTWSTDFSGSNPDDIVLGADNALWFTEPGSNSLGRAVPGANGPTITHLTLPTAGGAPSRIVVGPDQRIWFSAPGTNRIGRLGDNGLPIELPVPASIGTPGDVAPGTDGALWFVANGPSGQVLGRMTDAGTATSIPLPDPAGTASDLILGTDGDLRYTRANGRIGRVSTAQPLVEEPPPPVVPPALVPVAGRSVIVEVVSGTIRVRYPGRKVYQDIPAGGVSLPDGTEVDATKGRVRIVAETAPNSGITRAAIFWDGRFIIHQARIPGAATEVRLTGALACGDRVIEGSATTKAFGSAAAPRSAGSAAQPRAAKKKKKKKAPKVGRRLWGDGKGDFRTRGARATASVMGTRWLVEDRCDHTTRVRVDRGVVSVRDRIRMRRVTLTEGKSYVAPGARVRKKR